MYSREMKVVWLSAVVLLSLSSMGSKVVSAQETKKTFTVADEIGLTLFGDPNGGKPEAYFSPDGNYFAVWTERGRLDLNRSEDSLRFYRSQEIENFLAHPSESPPSPVWVVNRSDKKGSIIKNWRWLADSSGIAFLEPTAAANQRLLFADLRKKVIEPLTSVTETVGTFDIRDRNHYVYTAADSEERKKLRDKMEAERLAPAIVGTGRQLYELVFPDDQSVARSLVSPPYYLWAVLNGDRFEVKHDGVPLVPDGDLALSPDGGSVVTKLPVSEVPASWETLYPPPYASFRIRIHAGRNSAHQYVRINLQKGSTEALTDAPSSNDAGWWAGGSPSWSSDGKEILLPGTFLSSKGHALSRPCVAIVDLPSDTRSCVEMLKGHTETGVEDGYHLVWGARFAGGDKQRIIVTFMDHLDESLGATEYRRIPDGTWQVSMQIKGEPEVVHNGLRITVKQGLNDPPLLFATNKQTSRAIWDPNPQLKKIELGQASIYNWKDKEGRDWRGGLYKPSDYKSGQHYPLVIQTHGFVESEFRPSGLFPAAFAAKALASVGIVVLQVGEHCPTWTPSEGPCAVAGYESAANQLVSEGMIDPEKIGIIGFSRTCFYVMETLTAGSLHLKAASITDGVMEGYLQYMLFVDPNSEANSMIGAKPFGEGLQQWLKRSPGFNLDKVNAPLLVVGEGPISLLGMWEAYAGLRYVQKPVDLIMLNTDEHVLTNPAVRLASQGGSVDWFRFWLQGYEDPDPAKKEQYERWRGLRKMQEESDANSAATKN